MTVELEAVKHGYAYVEMNERGHFFSEGNYDILGPPLTDGYDEITWIATQPWSNGKVGLDRLLVDGRVAAGGGRARRSAGPGDDQSRRASAPASAASGPTTNRATGTAAAPCRCCSSPGCTASRTRCGRCSRQNTSQADLIRASKTFDLAQQQPAGGLDKAFWHLPEKDIIKAVGRPARDLRRHHARHGHRRRDDRAHAQRSGLVPRRPVARQHEDQHAGALVHDLVRRVDRPNLADVQPRAADGGPGDRQAAVRRDRARRCTAPTPAPPRTRWSASASMGDARYDYDGADVRLVRPLPEGREQRLLDTLPKVRYYTMGLNKWQSAGHAGRRPAPSR